MEPIEITADRILTAGLRQQASDIHIIPRKDDFQVQLRIANNLIPHEALPHKHAQKLLSHFKFLASMDIGEKRRPQSGSFSVTIDNKQVGLRFSTLPTANTESLVIRLIPQQHILPLNQMSLFPKTVSKLMALLKHSHGLLIFTGPTGSGKTTTLYSLLNHASEFINRNVITLEDPIENYSEQVLQVQINEKAGITYSVGLKAALRHDPDIIMVGEIRDAETAKIAVRAALTGHLILSTMHTRDAKGAVYRLLEFGVSLQEVQQTLIGVTAQRLLELSCPNCGGTCQRTCSNRYKTRASVYELLCGKDLAKVFAEAKGEGSSKDYRILKDEINKAVALGYVQEKEFYRWVYEYESQ
ncbi:competence type IV pilus ATPase ComGA [Peribacillus deserti]|uniref:Competence protein ComG n=1 Tax=Peribacillus deserti TaxID=673318 RepID=A0A2N5M4C7_9BACI|nr:competence type IV pilus ATPase ComGA [Peribacillus deserti]PLT29185.1 competence protein ComG [Peribacillus deserti]